MWEIFETNPNNGYASLSAAMTAGAASGPFSQTNAMGVLAALNSAINDYNAAVVARGAYAAHNIMDPYPITPPGIIPVGYLSTGGTWATSNGPAATLMTYTTGTLVSSVKPYDGPFLDA